MGRENINTVVAVAALILSIGTAISDKVTAIRNDDSKERQQIYNGYHLGQSAGVIYAYARASHVTPTATGQTGDKVADSEIAAWTFAAQSYAHSFQVTPDRFVIFRNLLEVAQPNDVSQAFTTLSPSVLTSGGEKANAAYELGWRTTVLAIGFYNPTTGDDAVKSYATIRDDIDSDLKTIGVRYSMPNAVTNHDAFVEAMKGVIKVLSEMPPH